MLKLNKKGISSGAASLILILLVSVAVLQFTGVVDFAELTGRKEVEPDKQVVFCDPTAGITVKLDARDPFGAVTVGGSNYYKTSNGDTSALSSVSDAGTFSAAANSKLDLYMQLDGNDHYTKEILGRDVKCSSPLTITEDVMAEGNLSFTFKNEDGTSSILKGVSNETLGVGDIVDLDFTVKGDYQRHQPYNLVVVEWNKTAIDEVFLTIGGTKLGKAPAGVPESHTDAISTGGRQVAYVFPTVESNTKIEGYLTVDVDDTVEPISSATLGESCIWLTFFDNDCVEIDEAPYVACGVTEDPDDGSTDVGDANDQTYICYS